MSYVFKLVVLCALADVIFCDRRLHVVDLTHNLGPDTAFYPGSPPFNFTQLSRGYNEGFKAWFEWNYFGTSEHGGTHFDAPSHFFNGHWRAHDIPVERLIGSGVVINVKKSAAKDPDYLVTVTDLLNWEYRYQAHIPEGAVVLMNSGWSLKYPDMELVFGTSNVSDISSHHFPGFHVDAANWLAKNRNVHVIGVDTPSTDGGQSKSMKVHITLGRNYIIGAEGVANLDEIPERGATVYVGTVKLFDGSGGPARIIATYYGQSVHASDEL